MQQKRRTIDWRTRRMYPYWIWRGSKPLVGVGTVGEAMRVAARYRRSGGGELTVRCPKGWVVYFTLARWERAPQRGVSG